MVWTPILGLLASCTTTALAPSSAPVTIPVHAEPVFQEARYDALPSTTAMIVRHDTAELIALLRGRFPALTPDHAALSLQDERLVVSGGSPFRRIWFSYSDLATATIHGPCSQNLHLWFAASGDLADLYVEARECPI